MESLKVSLESYNADIVKGIADTLGLMDDEEGYVRKSDAVKQLLREIPKRARSREVVAALTPAERAALAVILEHGGRATPGDLITPLALAGLLRIEGSRNPHQPTMEQVLTSLLQRGFIVNVSEPTGYRTRRTFSPLHEVAIPPEVVQALPKDMLEYPESQPDLHDAEAPDRVESRDPEDLRRQLFFVWAEIRREPGRALKAGGIYKRDVRRIAQSMGLTLEEQETEDTLRRMVSLLMAADLLQEENGMIWANDSPEAQGFWDEGTPAQLSHLLRALPSVELDLESLVSQGYYGYPAPIPQESFYLYREVLALLNKLTDLTWFPFDTFVSLLNHGRAGDFLFPAELVDDLYRRLSWYSWDGSQRQKKADLGRNLQKLETQAVLQLLDSLVWLGVVVLGFKGGKGTPELLRLSPPAHAALTHQPYEEPPAQPGQIIVQPDFQVLALGPVEISTLARIEEIAEREKIQPASVSYRITRDSVYPALQSGQTVGEIRGFLEEVTGQPVPQNVLRTLQEWGTQHERIVIRRDVLIFQTDTPQMLDDLLDDRELKQWLHRVDERTAWVHSRNAHRVEQRLEALELLPSFSRGPEADLPQSLRWEEDELRSRYPLPSLYVAGTVRRIAEDRDGGWALTPESVSSAVTAGLEAPEIVSLLERMTGDSLPEDWEKRLKAWSGHYGEVQTARVRLLRLESPETLRELRESDRRLSRWLRPLGKRGSLAVVRDEKWEQVVELLEEWGVAVAEKKWW